MLEKLGQTLRKMTDKIASAIFVDKTLVESIIKELQRALLDADVNVFLVKQLSEEIRKKALDEKLKGVEKKEQIIKLLHDRLLELLGGEKAELEIKKNQKILLLGLYGSGKTTTSAKLANYYSKRGLKACILGLDVHRPAASEQLEQLGKQHSIKIFTDKGEKNPIKIYEKYKKEIEDYDLLIVDTAGRHTLDKELVEEIKKISKKISPDYIILVIPADIGQSAKTLASQFKEALNINGVIITRMDSSAKGGGALTACSETKAKVFFITTGEKINDIETFNPSSFISRILGMGDIETLIEKVNSVVSQDKQKATQKRLEEGKFTMDDMLEQLESLNQVGTFDKIMEMIPGLGKAKLPDNLLSTQEGKMKKWKFAIQSMTQEEKENPEIIEKQSSRIQRISKGSGISTSDIKSLLKQYKILKDFIKSGDSMDLSKGMAGISQKQMQKLARKFGKKVRI
ncbi:signal recognition particle protein [Candidatus Pacearchaeota archaeon]|nr:signal recognition particle protein [Candidatus Pacearchaeota archaeon]